jgi:hypothetical protein
VFILIFLALVVGGSLALFAWRAPRVGMGGSFELVSRESMLHGQQRAAAGGHGRRAAGHAVPAADRRAGHGQAVGRPALLSTRCSCR